MADKTYYQLYASRVAELQPLYSRMRKDKDLYWLAEYKMKQLDGQYVPKDRVHNVTLNDPALFAYRSISSIASAHQQIVVEGKGMSDAETTYVEDFLNAMLYEIDVRIGNLGKAGLFPFVAEQSCIRGRISARVALHTKTVNGTNVLIPDIMPWDTGFVAWRNDLDGHVWMSYETERSKEDIVREYPETESMMTGSTPTILDFYTRKDNEVWIGDKPLRTRKHSYGEVPAIYQIVPAGSMLADSAAVSHEGESIFALDRDIWPELNKAASVLQTLNMMTFLPGLQYESNAGTQAELPDRPPYGVGVVTAVEKGGGFKTMPIEDIRNATRHLLAMLEGRAQRGSLPAIDYGNLAFPLSAVAIAKLTESKDLIYVPRLQAIAMFYQRLSRMMIRQYQQKGMAMEFGEEGHRRKFDPDKLNGQYNIKFRYFSQSPQQVIANFTIGAAAYQLGYSQHTIFTDILKNPNPMQEIMKRRTEDAEELDPVLKLHNTILALYDADEDVQADILADTVIRMIQARQQQQQEPLQLSGGNGSKRKALEAAKGLLPMFGEGANGGGGGIRRGAKEELEISEQAARDEEKRSQMAQIARTRRETEKVE